MCSGLKPSLTPTLNAINLDNNSIAHILGDPFVYCKNLTSISIGNNLIDRLPSGIYSMKKKNKCICKKNLHLCQLTCFMSQYTEFFESTISLQRLNISHNALSEFDGGILSRCKHIIELDLSHNQITILKVNEVIESKKYNVIIFICLQLNLTVCVFLLIILDSRCITVY